MSVDRDYGSTEKQAKADAQRVMKDKGVSEWPCVIEPTGWPGVRKLFGIDGYQVVVVDPKGIVVTADTYGDQLEGYVRKALGLKD